MNTKLLLLVLIIAGFSSCSTAYKAGQTPDDVYYSPVRPQDDYVRTQNDNDNNVYNNTTPYYDNTIITTPHNRRWRRQNRNLYGSGYVDPKTGYTTPAPKQQPRKVNLGGYTQTDTTASTTKSTYTKGNTQTPPTTTTAPVRTFPKQSGNSGTGVGNFIRKIFSGTRDNNNSNNTNNTNTRTFSNTNNNNSSNNNSNNSSSSGSGSGSSGSSAPVRSFGK